MFYLSVRVVSRANAGRRLPYWRAPEVTPRAAIGLRVGGIALVVFCVCVLVPTVGYWSVSAFAAVCAPTLVTISLHNRRVFAGN